MIIGEKINELRKKSNMTQEMLADALGVTAQAVSKWERGVTNPDLFLIPSLAEVFGVTSDELLGLSPQRDSSECNGNDKLENRISYLEHMLGLLMAGDADEALEYSLSEAHPLLSFDFSKMGSEECRAWQIRNGCEIDNKGGRVRFRSAPVQRIVDKGVDPQIINENIKIDLTGINHISVRLCTFSNNRTETLQIFFKTVENPTWDEQKSFRLGYPTAQTVNLSVNISNPYWFGTLTGLRIDSTSNYSERSEVGMIALSDYNGEVRYICEFNAKNPEVKNWRLVHAYDLRSEHTIAFRTEWIDRKKTFFDPIFENNDIRFDIGRAKYVHIRMRTDPINTNLRGWENNKKYSNAFLNVFFKTESSDVYNEQKRVRHDYVAGAGMLDLYVDMSQNGFWNGILTGLRIDPTENIDARYEIELIEIPEPTAKVKSASFLKNFQDRLDNIEQITDTLQGKTDELESMIYDLEGRIDDLE